MSNKTPKVKFQYSQGDITDANYLYGRLVGDCDVVSSLNRLDNGSYLLSELEDGRRIVLACPTFPKPLKSQGYMVDFDESDPVMAMEEMFLNGMGAKIDFTDNAFIRILTPSGKAEPVVFRDFADALSYCRKN